MHATVRFLYKNYLTKRDQFLSRKLDLSSLETLNKQLTNWIEEKYNASTHSAISMTPISRFALDAKFVKFLPPNQTHDELFYAEDQRMVKKDNTFSFKSIRYEPSADLRNKKINIRYERNKLDKVIVYYKNHRIGKAREVDLILNSKIKRGGRL